MSALLGNEVWPFGNHWHPRGGHGAHGPIVDLNLNSVLQIFHAFVHGFCYLCVIFKTKK